MRSMAFQKIGLDEDTLPWWQRSYIIGFDEGDGGEGAEGEGSDGGEGEEGEGGEDEPDESTPDGLKKALEKERALRKEAEKKSRITAKKLANATASQSGKPDEGGGDEGKGDKTGTGGSSTTDAKMGRLIETIRNNELKAVVSRLASNFQDPEDVFAHLDVRQFEYEQDDDDPSNVVFNEAEIRTAIKDLAKRKSYLLKPATDGQSDTGRQRQSGPKFAGRGSGKQTGGLSSAEIASRFPAMRTAIRAGKPKSE
jgi:hypothetical protein